jgi:hypothetical protein
MTWWTAGPSRRVLGKWALFHTDGHEMQSYPLFDNETTAKLYNADKSFNDQSMAFYEAQARQDFARNHARDVGQAEHIRRIYSDPDLPQINRLQLPDPSALREEIANNRRRWNEARGHFDAWLKICEQEKARVKGREAK